jgi:hypothetical protein
MPTNALKIEAELRTAVIDRLIAAILSDRKLVSEASLQCWRTIGTQKTWATRNEL